MTNESIASEALPVSLQVLLGLMVFASIAAWVWIAIRLRAGRPLFPFTPRRAVPWSVWHMLATICVMLGAGTVAQAAFMIAFGATTPVEFQAVEWVQVAFCTTVVVFAIGGATLYFISNSRYDDIGLGEAPFLPDGLLGNLPAVRDVVTGLVAFAAIAPLIYAMHLSLRIFDDGVHPTFELFSGDGDRQAMLLATAHAVLLAPLTEEFMFRVVLQGWLERIMRQPGPQAAGDSLALPVEPIAGDSSHTVPTDAIVADAEEETDALPDGILWAPILISSIAFALMHMGQGPAPVPLFFFAMVLGYVYQRTHRVLPCIVLHMALNAYSMASVWLTYGA